jgi:hypothetical protein
VGELWFDAVADETLRRLEQSSDPQTEALLSRIDTVFDQLAADPGDASVRRRRFQSGLWLVTLAGREGEADWAVLWEPHIERSDDVMIHYVGPASFA